MQRFHKCFVVHVLKLGNGVVHALARLGLKSEEEEIWIEDYPNCIHSQLLADKH
ncbi:hypothetical protein PTKIN_Ptkin19aG0052700 [Pterospermum kingtungense]